THPRTGVSGFIFTVILALTAVLCGADAAKAGVVSIYVNDGSGWVQISTTSGVAPTATVGSYTTNKRFFKLTNSHASMQDGPLADVNSSTFHLQHIGGGSNDLQVAVIGSDFTSPNKAPIYVDSQVSGINNSGSLTALTFQSYIDSSNNTDPGKLAGGI